MKDETTNFCVSTGKYKKVNVYDGNDYVQIFNDVESPISFNTRIVISDSRFNRTKNVEIDVDEKSLKMLRFALNKFFGEVPNE